MTMMGTSLRTTLVGVLLATLAIVLLIVSVTTHVSLRSQLDAQLDAELQRAVARSLGPVGQPGEDPLDPLDVLDAPGQGEFLLGVVMDGDDAVRGAWVDDTGTLRELGASDLMLVEEALAGPEEGPGGFRDVTLSIGGYRIAEPQPGQSPEGREPLVTGIRTDAADGTLARLDGTLMIVSIVALLGAGLVGRLVVGRALRPLEQVADLASRVADMPLEDGAVALPDRVGEGLARSGTEVGEVGRALNALLDNVGGALEARQQSQERMRRFIADASHELRTPLTAIRGYTELLRMTERFSDDGHESLDRVEAQSARMTALVEDLLLLARLDEGAPREQVRLDLGEILLEASMDARVSAPEHRWELDLPDAPIDVNGDPLQLHQVVSNLLSNAHRHTPAGTRIAVSLSASEGQAVLAVTDDGPGIDPAVQGDVFGRFTRADRARSGGEGTTGLGLPIVRAILEGHGGGIDLESRPGRTVFTARVPLAK